ncbi:hypothetical protein D3C75_530700 [compost metagenome]
MGLRNPLLGGRRPLRLVSEGPKLLVLIECDVLLVFQHRNDQASRKEGIDEVTGEVPHYTTSSIATAVSTIDVVGP